VHVLPQQGGVTAGRSGTPCRPPGRRVWPVPPRARLAPQALVFRVRLLDPRLGAGCRSSESANLQLCSPLCTAIVIGRLLASQLSGDLVARGGLPDCDQWIRAGCFTQRRPHGYRDGPPVPRHDIEGPCPCAPCVDGKASILETAHLGPADPDGPQEFTDRDAIIVEVRAHAPASVNRPGQGEGRDGQATGMDRGLIELCIMSPGTPIPSMNTRTLVRMRPCQLANVVALGLTREVMARGWHEHPVSGPPLRWINRHPPW
jgi:hypothetical protein